MQVLEPENQTNTNLNALIPSVPVDLLVSQREAMINKAKELIRLADEVDVLAVEIGIDHAREIFKSESRSSWGTEGILFENTQEERIVTITKRVDSYLWDRLMKEAGFFTYLDSKAREEWWEKIHKNEIVPFTKDNIYATFHSMHEQRGDMMERGVLNVFKRLSWDYKTNSPMKFGKKIISNNLFEMLFGNRGLRLRYRNEAEMQDLDRIFRVIDGKPEQDHRSGIVTQINDAFSKDCCTVFQNEYFEIKGYKKGTGHITFLRPDLVTKLNKILAKHYPNTLPKAA